MLKEKEKILNKLSVKILLGINLFFAATFANASSQAMLELQNRLKLVSEYKADFSQVVRSQKGKIIQKGEGTFQVKNPNLFRMDIKKPQENIIVSDSKNLWFYDPFVSQVTVNWVDEAINNTPFVLLTNNNKENWNKYDVEQKSDNFTLKPKLKTAIQQFDVRITSDGLLKGFSVIEKNGQSNLYVLNNISTMGIDLNKFKFEIPKDAEVDDQRVKK